MHADHFQELWNFSSRWRLRTLNSWSRSCFLVLAHNAICVHVIKTWCEAFSSSQVALRGIPWSDGKMLEIPYLYDNFGARLLSEGVLDHQISKGRISSEYMGKFQPRFWWIKWSLSLSPGWIPSFRLRKMSFLKSIQGHLGNVWESLGVVLSDY